MAIDPRKRQKKLERKKAKERKSLTLARSRGTTDVFVRSATAPIHECSRSADLWEQGIGWVVVSRQLSNGQIAFACFLLDVFCLGVKDVHCNVVSQSEYEKMVDGVESRISQLIPISPADARKLVEDAVVYANGLGILPHADYRRAQTIFGDIDAGASDEQYTFGKDGKPYFISGPNDSVDKCRRIVGLLHSNCGPSNYNYVVHASEAEFATHPLPSDFPTRK